MNHPERARMTGGDDVIPIDAVREYLLRLPGVKEGTHFGRPVFMVDGKSFVGTTDRGERLTLRLDRGTADRAVAEDSDAYELIWRGGKTFLGLSIRMASARPDRLRELLNASWRHMTGHHA